MTSHARLTLAIPGTNWQASFFEHAAPAPCWPAYGRLPSIHMFSSAPSDDAHIDILLLRDLCQMNVPYVGGGATLVRLFVLGLRRGGGFGGVRFRSRDVQSW
jgi:hypothetical protein